ncbi:MAG: DEAD/DEAH box helicase family protein [Bdellovibrionales bacterium]|nr:DEAD/DEAH box helicase family protein [Bdellovibrionales bacterium]
MKNFNSTEIALPMEISKLITLLEDSSRLKKPKHSFRQCQIDAYFNIKANLEKYRSLGANGQREFVVQMATGTGKSGLICLLATTLNHFNNVLVLTHSVGIRDQLRDNLNCKENTSFWAKLNLQPNPYELIDVSKAGFPGSLVKQKRTVVLSTVQSLLELSQAKRNAGYDLVIFDEGHRKGATVWEKIVNSVAAPNVLITATPFRSEKILHPDFKYTFADALKSEDKILKRVKIVQKSESLEEDILLQLRELRATYDLSKNKPRAMIRCNSFLDTKKNAK